MKTHINPIVFLYRNHDGKMKKSFDDSSCYEMKITMMGRQLLYESTANDIYWVFQTKRHSEKLEKSF